MHWTDVEITAQMISLERNYQSERGQSSCLKEAGGFTILYYTVYPCDVMNPNSQWLSPKLLLLQSCVLHKPTYFIKLNATTKWETHHPFNLYQKSVKTALLILCQHGNLKTHRL